jgi:hypothetical protein
MTTLLQTGGTLSTLSYNLEMYNTATTSWSELVGDTTAFTGLTYTKTGLTVGTDYRFRLRAENVHGFGPYTDEVTIRADEVPA